MALFKRKKRGGLFKGLSKIGKNLISTGTPFSKNTKFGGFMAKIRLGGIKMAASALLPGLGAKIVDKISGVNIPSLGALNDIKENLNGTPFAKVKVPGHIRGFGDALTGNDSNSLDNEHISSDNVTKTPVQVPKAIKWGIAGYGIKILLGL